MKKVFLCLWTISLSILSSWAGIEPVEKDVLEVDSLTLFSLQEVEVIASRATSTTPVAFSDLKKEEIEEFNFGKDIPFLLSLTPSVVATSEAGTGIGYSGFRIRGTDANRINITSNGIPMNDAESQGVFWVNIPDFASSIEDLQVQRGVGTSTNGAAAFGASINMKTDNLSPKAFAEIDGGYGSFNTSKVTLKAGTGTINDRWSFETRLSSIESDGYIDRASVNLKSYFFQGAYFINNTFLKFITFGGKEKTYHAWDGVPFEELQKGNRTYNPSGLMGEDENGNSMYYKDQTDNYIQSHYQLSLTQILSPKMNLNISLHYTRGDGYYEQYKDAQSFYKYGLNSYEYDGETISKSDLIREKHLANDFYGGVFALSYKEAKWDLTLGGGINNYDGNHFGYVTWTKNYAGDKKFYPNHEYYRSKGEKLDMNIYLKGNYYINSSLNLYGDIQFRRIDYKIHGTNDTYDWVNEEMESLNIDKEFNFFNPKAGINYQINKYNNAYASFAVAHREPNRNNYTDAVSTTPAKAEQLMDYEIGYKFNNGRFAIGANLYYMSYKDQLILDGTVNEIGEALTVNVPDSYRTGIELILGAKIAKWLKWDGNVTLSDNKIKDYTQYTAAYYSDGRVETKAQFYESTPIAYSPSVIANSLFSFQYKSFTAGLQSSFVSRQYFDNTGNKDKSIDPYFVNNLRLGYSFKLKGIRELAVNLMVNNLFNEKYESNAYGWSYYSDDELIHERFYFPQAGTHFMSNIVLKF